MSIEYILLGFLLKKLSVPVYMEEPDEKDAKYVLIEKTGTSVVDRINNANFAIQSYGASLQDAIDLNEEVKTVMEEFYYDENVLSCKLNSDYNYTDDETKRYRYQAVYVITF